MFSFRRKKTMEKYVVAWKQQKFNFKMVNGVLMYPTNIQWLIDRTSILMNLAPLLQNGLLRMVATQKVHDLKLADRRWKLRKIAEAVGILNIELQSARYLPLPKHGTNRTTHEAGNKRNCRFHQASLVRWRRRLPYQPESFWQMMEIVLFHVFAYTSTQSIVNVTLSFGLSYRTLGAKTHAVPPTDHRHLGFMRNSVQPKTSPKFSPPQLNAVLNCLLFIRN